jgi:sugar phosphate isomerase/epimerase
MLLSLSGFLFEDGYHTQSIPFARFCRMARAAGYVGVELRRTQVNLETSKPLRRELLDIVTSEGLTVTCLTTRGLPPGGPQRDVFFDRYLELCRDLRCGLLKISSDAAWLRDAAARAAAHDVALAGNNHLGGDLETVAGTRRVLGAVGHPNYGLLYDPAHLTAAGEDCLGCIGELLPVTRNVLVQSIRPARAGERAAMTHGGRRWAKGLIDETGVQDWPAILSTFRRLGYDGLVTVIENGWPNERRSCIARRCADAIRAWWNDPSGARRCASCSSW